MSERILVTGGAGFVGSHLCDVLVERGSDVVVFDDLSRGRREWLPGGCRLVEGDVRDADAIHAVVGDVRPDVIVHLAALHFIPAVDEAPELANAINVAGTGNVMDAARGVEPRRVVFASTAAVYPVVDGRISESTPVAPIDLYGRTKVEGERLLAEFAAETGATTVAARLFNVVGPRETNPHVVPEIVQQVRSGADVLALGALDTRRDYVDARDVATALAAFALGDVESGSFNVGTGVGVSVSDLVDACRELTGRPIDIRVDPARLRAVDRPTLIADPTAISEAVGWEPTRTIKDTLAELLAE